MNLWNYSYFSQLMNTNGVNCLMTIWRRFMYKLTESIVIYEIRSSANNTNLQNLNIGEILFTKIRYDEGNGWALKDT